ncbi:MAG: HD domain-containing phosphohydrolase [Sediminispirochaetaceae bacterium]
MIKTDDVYSLLMQLDKEAHIKAKLEKLKQWFIDTQEVDDFRIINFSYSEADTSAELIHYCSSGNPSLFPAEPALLNGRSAIPKEIFPKELQHEVTVYYPFRRKNGEPEGAILFKCSRPKQFLKRNRKELGIVASKVGDELKISSLKRTIWEYRNEKNKTDGVSREMLARLMDYMDLPMYITDSSGNFSFVNHRFCRDFSYSGVDELNRQASFFINKDSWSKGIRKITGVDPSQGLTMKVRSGKGTTMVVKESAVLVGRDTMGVLFDITPYINWNEKLQETVDELKTLNEKLSSTSAMLQKTQTTTMKSLAKLAEYRDMETGNHLHRICEFNRLLSSRVKEEQPYSFHIAEEYVQDIYLSGMLHDIGKVGVPDQILLKHGALSENEWEIMKKHTLWGWDLLKEADHELGEQSFLTLASRIALSHHERYDGMGYPKRLSGEKIPLSARISAVSDVYDALTSKRPYKEAWSHESAIEEIVRQRGKQFDPVIVDILGEIENEFHKVKVALPDSSVVN